MIKRSSKIYFVLYAASWGVLLGAGLGFVFQLAVLGPVYYGLFGLAIGALIGIVLGIVNGVALVLAASQFADPLINTQGFENKLGSISILITFIGSLFSFFVVVYFLFRSTYFAFCITVPATFFATASAYYASQKLSKQYLNALAKSKEQ